MSIQSICVFCGSAKGEKEIFEKAASDLGVLLAKKDITLVYGGGNIGLMGISADACLENGGIVKGVIPYFLAEREVAHQGITELIVVDTMHQRKKKMAELSDAFFVLPGGIGTMEEFFEVLTWAQLKIHKKPIGILNLEGFYDKLLDFIEFAVTQGFIKSTVRELFIVESSIEALLAKVSEQKA